MLLVAHESLRAQLEAFQSFADTHPEVDPGFRQKFRQLATPQTGAPLLRLLDYQLSLAGVDVRSKVILDAGCGTGIFSVVFLLNGAARVEAFDMQADNIASLNSFLKQFPFPMNVRFEDVMGTDLPDESIDFIFCREAISHFQDWCGFLDEAVRVLRPGGRILISDHNNGANPRLKRSIHRMWQESETGPFVADNYDLAGQKNLPYLYRRWMLIRREFPDFSDQEVFHLSLRTTGLGGEDLLEACREYRSSKRFPERSYRYGDSPRRPENGQRNEEPVDPREIVAILRKSRIRARILPHFGFNRNRWLPAVNRTAAWAGLLTLPLCTMYNLVGFKPPNDPRIPGDHI